jgi:hypothetical protein
MTQALGIKTQKTTSETDAFVERERLDRGAQKARRPIDSFLSELRRMTPQERIRASRYTMTSHERYVYAAHYPDEVPTLNGELEWIAATLE